MTEKQIVTRIRQIMYDRKISGTESNAGELNRLKAELKALRSKQGVAEDTEAEGATVKNSLHTIIRVATHLDKQMGEDEDFPEWVSEKIGSVKDQMVAVMDYEISDKEMQGMKEETALDNVRGQSDILSRMQARSQQRDDDMRDEEMNKKHNRQRYNDASTQNDIDTLAYRLDRLKRQDDDWEHTFDMLRDRTNRYQRSGQQGVDPNIKYRPTVKENKSRAVDKKGRTQQQWIQLVTQKYPDAKIMQAKMIDGSCYATLSDGKKLYWYPATQSTADRKEETSINQEKARDTFANMFGGPMQQLANLGIRKNRDVSEANRNQDRHWEDEAEQEMSPDKNSPYYVLWTGQSHEWYGDGDPKSGDGRYKPKGEAGGIVAINIKDRDTAEKIADDLNTRAEDGSFPEKSIYNKWNEDSYLVDYMGAEARSMKKIDEYEQRMLDYDLKSGRVKNYANQDMAEGGMGGINRCAPSNDVSYEKVLDEVKQQWKADKNTVLESKITTAVDYILSEKAPCWKNYKQIGMKVKGGKQVPNCVPVSEHEVTLEGDCFIGIYEDSLLEADYHGHKVQLGKPMQGDVKKFKVYVKDTKTGNIKKVNFGDPNMRIRKSNPGARKSFRARHHCENPGPRTSARYWSCRNW